MAFFPDQEIAADIDTSNGSATGVGYQLAIIPPGDSQIKITSGRGVVMRVFSSFSPDLAEKSYNAASYKTPHPNVAPFQAWPDRSEEHTSELQSLMRISYAVFCLKKKKQP